MKRYFIIPALLIFLTNLTAQVDTLFFEEYIQMVLDNHPLSIQADLLTERSDAYQKKARGNLDPTLYADFDRKHFKDINYYTEGNVALKYQTAKAVKFAIGYERNAGDFLNNDLTLPERGLMYGSVHVPLLNGLFFDETRYALKEAELINIKNELDRKVILNDLTFEAKIAYINWYMSARQMKINQKYLRFSLENHSSIAELYRNGYSPAMDTLESFTNMKGIENKYLKSKINYTKAIQRVQYYMWDKQQIPLFLKANIIPQSSKLVSRLEKDIMFNVESISMIPNIQKIDLELNFIELDEKLLNESVKPILDLGFYSLLNLGSQQGPLKYGLDDYKLNLSFYYPLLNRKNKGELELNAINKEQVEFEKIAKSRDIELKLIAASESYYLSVDRNNLVLNNIEQLNNLYLLEKEKFNLGEGTVYFLFKRLEAVIKSELDQIEIEASVYMNREKINYFLFLES